MLFDLSCAHENLYAACALTLFLFFLWLSLPPFRVSFFFHLATCQRLLFLSIFACTFLMESSARVFSSCFPFFGLFITEKRKKSHFVNICSSSSGLCFYFLSLLAVFSFFLVCRSLRSLLDLSPCSVFSSWSLQPCSAFAICNVY